MWREWQKKEREIGERGNDRGGPVLYNMKGKLQSWGYTAGSRALRNDLIGDSVGMLHNNE